MNEQKWRLKGTQITGETIGSHFVFYPDGWPDGCYMYVHPDMLEPADAPEGALDEAQRTVDKLFRDYPWLRDVVAALPKEDSPKPAPDWAAMLADHEKQLLGLTIKMGIHRARHEVEGEELAKRFAALEARLPSPTPSEPLKVGDEVWARGTIAATCPEKDNYRVDFGMGSYWCPPHTEIKRA